MFRGRPGLTARVEPKDQRRGDAAGRRSGARVADGGPAAGRRESRRRRGFSGVGPWPVGLAFFAVQDRQVEERPSETRSAFAEDEQSKPARGPILLLVGKHAGLGMGPIKRSKEPFHFGG